MIRAVVADEWGGTGRITYVHLFGTVRYQYGSVHRTYLKSLTEVIVLRLHGNFTRVAGIRLKLASWSTVKAWQDLGEIKLKPRKCTSCQGRGFLQLLGDVAKNLGAVPNIPARLRLRRLGLC